MDLLKLIGYAAALLTTISFLPQLVRTIRTRSACDLSFGMLALFLAGISLWLIYGLLSRQMPIILANGVTMLFNATLLVCKIVYK